MFVRRGRGWIAMVPLWALTACGGAPPSAPIPPGARIQVLASWSGAEQQAFEAVVAGFTRRTGVKVMYAGAPRGLADELAARIARAMSDEPDAPLQPRKSHHRTSPGRSFTSAALRSPSRPFR